MNPLLFEASTHAMIAMFSLRELILLQEIIKIPKQLH